MDKIMQLIQIEADKIIFDVFISIKKTLESDLKNTMITFSLKMLEEFSEHEKHLLAVHDQTILELNKTHDEEITKLKLLHEKAFEIQSSSMTNFTMVQSMSKENAENKRNLTIANEQIKSLKKQVTDLQSKQPHPPISKLKLDVKKNITLLQNSQPSTQEKHVQQSTIEQPIETPQQPVQPAETTQQPAETPQQPAETPQQPIETPQQPIETSQQPIETPQQLVQPEQKNGNVSANANKMFTKIKVKGVSYLMEKPSPKSPECMIYNCIDGNPGAIIGFKSSDGKYHFSK